MIHGPPIPKETFALSLCGSPVFFNLIGLVPIVEWPMLIVASTVASGGGEPENQTLTVAESVGFAGKIEIFGRMTPPPLAVLPSSCDRYATTSATCCVVKTNFGIGGSGLVIAFRD